MSLTRLFFGRQEKKSIGGITMDCFVTETHIRTSQLTQYPIEDGATISDHIINNPIELEVTGLKSAIGITVFDIRLGNAHISAFEQINKLIEDKTLVRVVTGFKVYEDMHIESFTTPRDSNNGRTLEFNMRLKQARKVTTQLTEVPNSQLGGDSVTNLQSQSPVDVGKTTSDASFASEVTTAFQEGQDAFAELLTGFDIGGL